jgi:prevent-host-death family protein
MSDQLNIAEAKAKFSSLIERVERGERIVIARNSRPVARLEPVGTDPDALVAEFQELRNSVRGPVRRKGESWQEFIHEGHRR